LVVRPDVVLEVHPVDPGDQRHRPEPSFASWDRARDRIEAGLSGPAPLGGPLAGASGCRAAQRRPGWGLVLARAFHDAVEHLPMVRFILSPRPVQWTQVGWPPR